MPLKYLILLIIAVCNIAWAFFIWLRNPKDKINIFFGLTIFFCGAWAGLLAIIDPLIFSDTIAIFLYACTSVFGLLCLIFFYIFTFYFPYQRKILTYSELFHIMLAFIALAVLILIGPMITSTFRNGDYWVYAYNSTIYAIYSLYIFFYSGLSFYNLMTSAPRGESLEPRVFHVLIGTLIAVASGLIFSLVIPYFSDQRYEWVAPYFSVFMIGYISYHIFIKR